MEKILFLGALIINIYFYLFIIKLVIFWLISFIFLYSCVLIIFYSSIRRGFFKLRQYVGIQKTSKKNLDKEFIKHGGIVGYQSIKEMHIALIFISDSRRDYSNICYDEVSPLIEDYDKKNDNYKLYFCYLTDDFLNIVKSKYVYGLHVFGHGTIDSLGFEDGVVQYRELKNTEPKEFVAQWHCNHGSGKSLGELIGRKYYVPYGYRIIRGNKKDISKLINNQIEWTKNSNVS